MVCLHLLMVYTLFPILCVWSHPDYRTSTQAKRKLAHFANDDVLDDDRYRSECNGIQSQKDRNSRRLAAMPTSKRSRIRASKHNATKRYKRDLDPILESQHGFLGDFDEETVIFYDPAAYRLQGEMTSGPYYVNGELIQSNITGSQEGIPLFLDIQLIDTNTCQPIEGIYIDIWHCNATGVYSGVKSMDNGNFGDEDNIDTSFLRGIQPTDSNGAVQFSTIFPGHYTVMSHDRNGDNV